MLEGSVQEEMAHMRSGRIVPTPMLPWLPVATALAYPWVLRLFHAAIASATYGVAPALCLAAAFALPLSCILIAWRYSSGASDACLLRVRRTAFAALAAPPLFVLVGVLSGLLHSPIKDVWVWSLLWLVVGITATITRAEPKREPSSGTIGRTRVLHGISASIILLFIGFHLFNHLTGLLGPDVHARVMAFGRVAYRSHAIEPVLVALLLFQIASGARLAWRWSVGPLDFARTVQIGSGAYLAAFILTHLNSAIVSARWVHGIKTDWAWAAGAPDGLLIDAWNTRLVPHYALGVFFVITHLFCGLRIVMLAHGVRTSTADRVWKIGLLCAGTVSLLITAALCGLRI
ncbi:hypothetical protein [Sphingobium nicotianae]|uniref:Succinate dehydrogenase n=1 Tax=Sphingobium nicotianae TaxID=2782607 RepID=A0A9X1AJ58_9SPHN|nr:hypothetical protein [Sphingobium nicotianae]MBT2185413.1 hypothetical protein [Sphingobium nicotianae]